MSRAAFIDDALAAIARIQVPEPSSPSPLVQWLLDAGLIEPRGLWCEFGVYKGDSLRLLAGRRGTARVVGFDSFGGLPEDWREGYAKGHFSLEAPPSVDGAEIVVGLFADTLPHFDDRGAPITLLHVDCDIYASAACVLEWAQPRLAAGAVVVFDELWSYAGFEEHEMRALYEAHERGMRWEWLAAVGERVSIRVNP
jgi:hypothetical protein